MRVLAPSEFSRLVFAASGSSPFTFSRSPMPAPAPPVQLFPSFQPTVRNPVPAQTSLRDMSGQVHSLELQMQKLSDELRVRSDMSRRERDIRKSLRQENAELRDEVARTQHLLQEREREIYDLEQQLRSTHTQLVLLKRRHATASAAVSAKSTPPPGTISSLPKEMRTIGTQINEIRELEDRIEALSEALVLEKQRNRRIKSVMVQRSAESDGPPLPIPSPKPIQRTRNLTTQCVPGTIIQRRLPRLSKQSYLEINARSIESDPPVIDSRSAQTQTIHMNPTEFQSASPQFMLSPIRKPSSMSGFAIFEDKENESDGSPDIGRLIAGTRASQSLRERDNRVEVSARNTINERINRDVEYGGYYESKKIPEFEIFSPPDKKSYFSKPHNSISSESTTASSSVVPSRVHPPPFIPQLNLASLRQNSNSRPERPQTPMNTSTVSTSSEVAIKRAVAAAIEKRKLLARQGINLGSARSSTSSFMTNSPMNISGVKARFCLPIG